MPVIKLSAYVDASGCFLKTKNFTTENAEAALHREKLLIDYKLISTLYFSLLTLSMNSNQNGVLQLDEMCVVYLS